MVPHIIRRRLSVAVAIVLIASLVAACGEGEDDGNEGCGRNGREPIPEQPHDEVDDSAGRHGVPHDHARHARGGVDHRAGDHDAPRAAGQLTYAKFLGDNPEIFVSNADGSGTVQLTDDPGRDLCPAFNHDASAILFCSDRTGQFEIWTMGTDGTGQRQLTDMGGRVLFPKQSPDGRTIAFSGAATPDDVEGSSDIWSIQSDGSGLTQLTSTPGDDSYVTWSPDGSSIAWVSIQDGSSEIWVMNADGSGARALTSDATVKDQLPDWSPDGRRIAYESGGDITVMNADGTGAVVITQGPAEDFGPAWSPDGTEIAFVSVRDDGQHVYVVGADGSSERPVVTDGKIAVPDWSPGV